MSIIDDVIDIYIIFFENIRDVSFFYKRFENIILMALFFLRSFFEYIIQTMRECTMRNIMK